jgi:hypothetical protein
VSDTATQTNERSRELAEAAGTAKDQAATVASDARAQASQVAAEAKAQARNVVGDARQQLREQADAQASKVVDSMRRVSDEFRALTEGRTEEATTVRRYVQDATGKIDELASHLDATGVDGLVDDVQRFARRRPGAFLLAAAGAGFLAGRFFRSVQDDPAGDDAFDPTRVGTATAPRSAPRLSATPAPGRSS